MGVSVEVGVGVDGVAGVDVSVAGESVPVVVPDSWDEVGTEGVTVEAPGVEESVWDEVLPVSVLGETVGVMPEVDAPPQAAKAPTARSANSNAIIFFIFFLPYFEQFSID